MGRLQPFVTRSYRPIAALHDRLLQANKVALADTDLRISDGSHYFDTTSAGGCQLPLPAGRIEGGAVFGQYRRITR